MLVILILISSLIHVIATHSWHSEHLSAIHDPFLQALKTSGTQMSAPNGSISCAVWVLESFGPEVLFIGFA